MQISRVKIDRLDLSERILAGWYEVPLGATPEEYLRLIGNEIKALEQLRHQDPERVADLLAGYTALSASIRAKLS